jgi:zinc-binding in reverse transcriptase
MTLHNKILTKDNLKKRGWSGDHSCVFCSNPESVDHLFFHCPFVIDFWSQLLNSHPQRRQLRVSSLLDFWNFYLSLSTFHFWGTILTACIWIICNTVLAFLPVIQVVDLRLIVMIYLL